MVGAQADGPGMVPYVIPPKSHRHESVVTGASTVVFKHHGGVLDIT